MVGGSGRRVMVGVVLALVASTTVAAPRAARTKAPALSPAAVAQLEKQLTGVEDDAAIAAAQRLGETRDPARAAVLIETLSAGTAPAVAAAALAALGKLANARAVPVLTLYAGNRNAEVRAAAVTAMGAMADGRVVATLLERLGDAEGTVRTAAAEALAARKEARAADRLLKLLARNEAGAAGPAGSLVRPADLARLTELQGRIDDAALATALGTFLRRDDVPDQSRVEAVRAVANLTGPAATTALVEYLAEIPEKDRRPSRAAATKALDGRLEKTP